MKTTTFLGFRNGRLITIVESLVQDFESAVDVDYVVTDPRDEKKQILEWRREK